MALPVDTNLDSPLASSSGHALRRLARGSFHHGEDRPGPEPRGDSKPEGAAAEARTRGLVLRSCYHGAMPEAYPTCDSASDPPEKSQRTSAALRWLAFSVLAAAFLAMVTFSLGKWPDVLVDFGAELYFAWQLSQGEPLVGESPWGGPLLSPYVNAGLFWLFGPGLHVLVIFNLLLLVALTWILYAIFLRLADRFTATLACLAFLTIFAFNQYVGVGNYNYVTPYSHGVTHGLFFSLVGILLMYRHLQTRAVGWLVASGLCAGLVFLTKPEIFVACAAALCAALLVRLRWADTLRGRVAIAVTFVAGVVVPPLLAFLLLLFQVEPSVASDATLGSWLLLSARTLRDSPFYLRGIGLDDPTGNLWRLVVWAYYYVVVFIPAALLDLAVPRTIVPRPVAAGIIFLAVLVPLIVWIEPAHWVGVARPLPLAMLVVGAFHLLDGWKARDRAAAARAILGVTMAVFSLALLLKIVLNARIYHYGFGLAMPAFLTLVAWLIHSVPARLGRRGGAGIVFRAATAAVLVALVFAQLQISASFFRNKIYRVGRGADAFLADARGLFVQAILMHIERHARPSGTLAVLPEGIMVNYLSRRTNPTGYGTYMPDGFRFFGGERPFLAAYQRRPPDIIVLVSRDASEHGARLFGRDYAVATMHWIRENYTPVTQVGADPLSGRGFGMLLLKRSAERLGSP